MINTTLCSGSCRHSSRRSSAPITIFVEWSGILGCRVTTATTATTTIVTMTWWFLFISSISSITIAYTIMVVIVVIVVISTITVTVFFSVVMCWGGRAGARYFFRVSVTMRVIASGISSSAFISSRCSSWCSRAWCSCCSWGCYCCLLDLEDLYNIESGYTWVNNSIYMDVCVMYTI